MPGGGEPHGRYADMFHKFFKRPNMASTYKPVFLASLADIAARRKGGPLDAGRWIHDGGGCVRVDLELVAVPFAKYYWDMAAAFNPRHMPARMADPDDASTDISIVGLIRDEIARMKEEEACRGRRAGAGAARGRRRGVPAPAGDAPPTLGELASDEMAGFRGRVVAKSIKPEVLVHLRNDEFDLYKAGRGRNSIVLDEEAVEYMRRNAVMLKAALSDLVARHLEANNPSALHVSTIVNLNKWHEDKAEKAAELKGRAMPPRDDLGPLYTMSLDVTAGLARLYRPRGRAPAGAAGRIG